VTTVLVTGGAGYVGVPTVRRLLDAGHAVAVFDNFNAGTRGRLEPIASDRLRVVEGDIRDLGALSAAVADVRPNAVIHLAALHFIPYCIAHPAETISVNMTGLQNVLDVSRDHGVERLVFTSTGDVYAPSDAPHREDDRTDPHNIYGASKLMGEWLIRYWRKAGAATRPTVVRLFNVVGPGETTPHVLSDICDFLKQGDVLRLGNREARRDYVYVGDVARALVELLDVSEPDLTVNVGSGRSSSVDDLVTAIGALTGRHLVTEVDPAKVRANDRPNLQADIGRLRDLLPDFAPTPLEEALRDLLVAERLLPS
jgi:UDP-glucose 4-epimerase